MKHYVTIYDTYRVKAAILKLTDQVREIIEDRGAENCIVLIVLEGGTYLANKIIDRLPQDMLTFLETASIKVSSYHGDQRGQLIHNYIPDINCKNKTVIIIDDFCDSGSTINSLNSLYRNTFEADDVIFVTLLARTRRKLNQGVKLLYGIEDNTENFYTGCGLDDNGKSRNINKIITVVDE